VALEQRFAIAPAISARASDEVRAAFDGAIDALVDGGPLADLQTIELPDIDDLVEIFRTVQSYEAWQTHGEWIEAHPGALGEEIEARFRFGQGIDEDTESYARQAFELARMRIDSILGDRILLLPSASSVAPSATAEQDALETLRAATLRLTCVAGLAGRPALSIPALRVGTAPVGLGIVGPVGTDLALIDLGAELALEL
jgi:Asp-tRNA(Asn)/Glu-tRNA(Gln) amidotransferase A subunit family amidase